MLINSTFGTGALPVSGFGTRMLFNPKTGAFRTGRITDSADRLYQTLWDFANMGDYSISAGVDIKAKGFASAVFGPQNRTIGPTSLPTGSENVASGAHSLAGGFSNTAYSFGEVVLGTWATEYEADGFYGSYLSFCLQRRIP